MATYSEQDATGVNISGVDLLLHPELMSQDFMQLVLREVSWQRNAYILFNMRKAAVRMS